MSIDTSLAQIEDILSEAKAVPLSTKVLIDAEEIKEVIKNIRLDMPEEIMQAKKIASDRHDIIEDANRAAEEITDKARDRADRMIEEHQITKEAKDGAAIIIQQAKDEAKEILNNAKLNARDITDKAEKWSNDIRSHACSYVEEIIRDTDETLTKSVTEIRKLRQSVNSALSHTGVAQKPRFDDITENL